MGSNSSHLPSSTTSRRTSSSRTSPTSTTTTSTSTTSKPSSTFTTSAPSTAPGSPVTTYTYTAPASPASLSAPSDERTSISCEPSSSPTAARDDAVPLRIGYPYYEDLTALQAKRGSRRRSKSLSKVLENIGFSNGGR